jgi:hypothetical protein
MIVDCRILFRFFRPITFHRNAFDQPVEGINTISYEMSPDIKFFHACIARFTDHNSERENENRLISDLNLFVWPSEAAWVTSQNHQSVRQAAR